MVNRQNENLLHNEKLCENPVYENPSVGGRVFQAHGNAFQSSPWIEKFVAKEGLES